MEPNYINLQSYNTQLRSAVSFQLVLNCTNLCYMNHTNLYQNVPICTRLYQPVLIHIIVPNCTKLYHYLPNSTNLYQNVPTWPLGSVEEYQLELSIHEADTSLTWGRHEAGMRQTRSRYQAQSGHQAHIWGHRDRHGVVDQSRNDLIRTKVWDNYHSLLGGA